MDAKTRAIFPPSHARDRPQGRQDRRQESLETMTPEERTARAKKASAAAAKKRTAARLERERAVNRGKQDEKGHYTRPSRSRTSLIFSNAASMLPRGKSMCVRPSTLENLEQPLQAK
jgi:hypothetical protein